MVATDLVTIARYRYDEVLTDLRLTEGGGFKVASQHRRALEAALGAVEGEIRAQALEDAAQAVNSHSEGLNTPESVERRGVFQRHECSAVVTWLLERAEEERDG